jgi:hypothetical protein
MPPVVLALQPNEIKKYYESTRLTHNTQGKYSLLLNLDDPNAIKIQIQEALLKSIPESYEDWHDVASMPEEEQKHLWSFRQWLFCQILIYTALTYKDAVSVKLQMFGSGTPTSDIDVSVESPRASEFIKAIEADWKTLTTEPTTKFDVEFYGDFLMFIDENNENNFLNSRKLTEIPEAQTKILAFVGVSILRNAGTLSFPDLDSFIASHPEVADNGWKQEAQAIFEKYTNMSQEQRQEQYYMLLRKAEEQRDRLQTPNLSPEEINRITYDIFMALCNANIYRSENYILPSTVIHVVRDIQAKAPMPSNRSRNCPIFKSKIASCPMGVFTYLCSAMEQLGYMKRFEGNEKKQAKYRPRFEDALRRIETGQVGGRSIKKMKSRRVRKGKSPLRLRRKTRNHRSSLRKHR